MKHDNVAVMPQPAPAEGQREVIDIVVQQLRRRESIEHEMVHRVIADLRARREVGIERYGTPLMTHNGRDALVDAYQEALDAVMYLGQAVDEGERRADTPLSEFSLAMSLAIALRRRLTLRERRDRACVEA